VNSLIPVIPAYLTIVKAAQGAGRGLLQRRDIDVRCRCLHRTGKCRLWTGCLKTRLHSLMRQ